jgi:hypothetical protein
MTDWKVGWRESYHPWMTFDDENGAEHLVKQLNHVASCQTYHPTPPNKYTYSVESVVSVFVAQAWQEGTSDN